MTKEISSYSSPFNLGHKALAELFDGTVVIQEKIDGSQISFGTKDGELFVRSRKQMVDLDDPQMFGKAVETIKTLALRDGYTYRGEYLQKPKHNTLAYERVPEKHIILFDVDKGDQDYMKPSELNSEAELLGLEVAPTYMITEKRPTLEELDELLERDSVLGGVKIEGVVIKNYDKFDDGKKTLMGKYVSKNFKEKHGDDWKKRNPSQNDYIQELIFEYGTEVRWVKAVQHLKEQGAIEGVPQDIPVLLREVGQDILAEYGDEIKEKLFKHFWKGLQKGFTRGLPEWYKDQLAQSQFED